MKHLPILKNIAKHIELNQQEQDLLSSLLKAKSIKKKECLLREGEICHFESFIVKGCLKAYSIDDKGEEHIAFFATEGWWISDLYSFIYKRPSIYFLEALENSELLQISKEDLEMVYLKIPKFERYMRIAFQNFIIVQQNRINQYLSSSAEQRYLNFISKYPKMEQRLTQKQIAAYIGVTPVFISMIRKKLSENKRKLK
jgi:CRP-like cAMP-binding protein